MKSPLYRMKSGNRIATIMIYVSRPSFPSLESWHWLGPQGMVWVRAALKHCSGGKCQTLWSIQELVPCQARGEESWGPREVLCLSFPVQRSITGKGGSMAPIIAAFPAECSRGWRLHCFHLCQFQRACGQGKESFGITGSREGRTLLSVPQLLQGVVAKPLLMPNPSLGLPNLFWGAKTQSWGYQVCFRVPNPSLLCRMQHFSGGTCGETGMVMGTPSMLAAPSWPGTSGVRDATRCHPGVTWGQLHWQGGKRGWECTNILHSREKVP